MDSGQHIIPGCIPLNTENYIEKYDIKVDDVTVSKTVIRKTTFYIS